MGSGNGFLLVFFSSWIIERWNRIETEFVAKIRRSWVAGIAPNRSYEKIGCGAGATTHVMAAVNRDRPTMGHT